MNDYLGRISEALDEAEIKHDCYHDCIHVQLPSDFGILEVKIWDQIDDSIELLGGDFHSHGEQLANEFNTTREKAIAILYKKIFSGEYLLIEEHESNKSSRKLIAQSLDNYLKYLPEGTEYTIANKI